MKSRATYRQSALATTVEVAALTVGAIMLWTVDYRLSAWILLCTAQASILIHNRREFKDDPE